MPLSLVRQVVELLSHVPQCRMLFNKFVPSYHHHFGHQCRVSDYGFTKLIELFEAIPDIVRIEETGGGERLISLTEREGLRVLGEQIAILVNGGRAGKGRGKGWSESVFGGEEAGDGEEEGERDGDEDSDGERERGGDVDVDGEEKEEEEEEDDEDEGRGPGRGRGRGGEEVAEEEAEGKEEGRGSRCGREGSLLVADIAEAFLRQFGYALRPEVFDCDSMMQLVEKLGGTIKVR